MLIPSAAAGIKPGRDPVCSGINGKQSIREPEYDLMRRSAGNPQFLLDLFIRHTRKEISADPAAEQDLPETRHKKIQYLQILFLHI